VTQPEATDPGLRISVTGPAEVTAGANPDPRVLGAHFERFLYERRP